MDLKLAIALDMVPAEVQKQMGRLEKQIMIGALALVGVLVAVVILKGLSPRDEIKVEPEGAASDWGTDTPALMLGPDGQPVVTPPETLLDSDLNAAPLEQPPLVVDLGSAGAAPAAMNDPFALLPADPSAAPIVSDPMAGQPTAPLDKLTYTIKNGDTLGHIAQRELGSVRYANDILLVNPGLNVNNLKVGTELQLPKRSELPPAPAKRDAAPAVPAAVGETTHSVVAGDTLWGLAARFLGDGSRSGEIVAANPDKLKSKDAVLTIGVKLRIPKR